MSTFEKTLSVVANPKDYSSLSKKELSNLVQEHEVMIAFLKECWVDEQDARTRSYKWFTDELLRAKRTLERVVSYYEGAPTDKRTRAYKNAQRAKQLNT